MLKLTLFDFILFNKVQLTSNLKYDTHHIFTIAGFIDLSQGFGFILLGLSFDIEWGFKKKGPEGWSEFPDKK